jgi:hypothetical protein
LVVQILLPVSRQPSPSGTARVFIIIASEPAPGSDMPKHMLSCPDIMPGSSVSRACGVSCRSTALGPNAQWLST